jgi:alpha-mannosidase
MSLSNLVTERSMRLLAKRVGGKAGDLLTYNPLGWARQTSVIHPQSGVTYAADLPPFGYAVISQELKYTNAIEHIETENTLTLKRGALSVTVNKERGVITQITSADFPDGVLGNTNPLCTLEMTVNGKVEPFEKALAALIGNRIVINRSGEGAGVITVAVSLAPDADAVDVHYTCDKLDRPDGTMGAALKTGIKVNLPNARLIHDTPYAVSEIRAEGKYLKKYPTGEWMTSPQVFEEVINPFTAYSLLDFDDGERGLLYLHDGSQAMLRVDSDVLSVQNILSMYDPWDEDYFVDMLDARFRFVPHGKIDHAQRWKLAQEFRRPALVVTCNEGEGDLPSTFSPILCDSNNVAVTAFYRETEENALGLDSYAGAGMGFPYVLRLVELNGAATTTRIQLPGKIASAFKTNLLGEIVSPLAVQTGEPYSYLELDLRPHEIATIYTDIEMGRKMPRNLDAYRFVWATVHRTEERQAEGE